VVHGNQAFIYNGNCVKKAQDTQPGNGQARIRITNATPSAMYVIKVKYDAKLIIGSSFAGPAPTCQYNFVAQIDGVDQGGISGKGTLEIYKLAGQKLAVSTATE